MSLEGDRRARVHLLMNVLVSPEMANFSGQMHGGDLLKLLDKVKCMVVIY